MKIRFRGGGNMGVKAYPAIISKTTDTTAKPEKLFEKAVDSGKLAITKLAKKH
jgi:hypothetical protein